MECPRCHSPMVKEVFTDPCDDAGAGSFAGWQCVICGNILDPIIVQNQRLSPSVLSRRTRRTFAV